MKSIITIKFEQVNDIEIGELLSKDKRFRQSTQKTIDELCKQLQKYFSQHNIKVNMSNELI